MKEPARKGLRRLLAAASLGFVLIGPAGAGLAGAQSSTNRLDKSAALPIGDSRAAESSHQYFKSIYRDFYEKYELGPEDEIAIRVLGQPDYSIERTKVSPVGRVYHPLIGDMEVGGMT